MQKNAVEEELKILKEDNINKIKKFENYLKILDKRINYINNEISIIYKINKNDNFVKIFYLEAKNKINGGNGGKWRNGGIRHFPPLIKIYMKSE